MKPIDRLLSVMERLRNPEGGCPWDVEQTFATIAPYTVEEAYEVADAVAEIVVLADDPAVILVDAIAEIRLPQAPEDAGAHQQAAGRHPGHLDEAGRGVGRLLG